MNEESSTEIPASNDESFGHWLKAQRELAKCTLEEIAAVTKVHIAQLKMLEDDKWDNLPAPAFVRGFLLCYARHIGLGEEEVLRRYKKQAILLGKSSDTLPEGMRAAQSPSAKPKVRVTGTPTFQSAPGSKDLDDGTSSLLTLPRVAGGLGIIVLISLVSWLISIGKSDAPKPPKEEVVVAAAAPTASESASSAATSPAKPADPAAKPTTEQIPGQPVTAAPAVPAKYSAEIRALEDNWINVRIDTDSPKGFQLKAGTVRTFEAQSKIHFVFSNAGVVDLKWNGIRFGNVGFRGDVKSITLPEQLAQLEAKKPQATTTIQPRAPRPAAPVTPPTPPAEAAAPATPSTEVPGADAE
jgi:cytoskeleton protein RodZ